MSRTGTEIAIIGIAGHYPKSERVQDFWRQVREGTELVSFFTPEELVQRGVPAEQVARPEYVRAAAYLEEMEQFDAAFFGITPREAALLDPQHRHFLECAWEALEDAGYNPQQVPGRVGVYAGAAMDTYLLYNLMRNPVALATDPLQLQLANDKDYLTTRVSYKLNLRGPSHLVQSACSSSLVATHVACQALLNEECDVALVGGASVLVHTRNGYLHSAGGVASVDGHCRSFDADATGTLFGSGVGCVVLKPLDRAMADGDTVHAIILGTAINNDGSNKVGFTAPSMDGVSEVVLEALGNAGVEPDSIGYVEAHGTATRLGDPIELQGLTRAWRRSTKRKQFCAIGSVKSNVGHLDAASGVTGLIKVALALRDRVIPPSLHFRRPNPALELPESPFFVNDRPLPWDAPPGGAPRRAAVSSLGIGGTNAHVILEEPPRAEASAPAEPYQLLVLSARTAGALQRATDNLADHLAEQPDAPLADAAYTLQAGRQHFTHRRFAVVRDAQDALAALSTPERLPTRQQAAQRPPVAFLFSGQGSQYAGMAAGLHRREPVFREHFDACAERVRALRGVDLRTLVLSGAGEEADARLKATEWAQPALFAVEYALARLLMHWGLRPSALLGHSIGEYVAACLAGVFSLTDAVTLVCERGRLMAGLPPGAMSAVPLAEEAVLPLLGRELSLAAVNAPGRCVVAGPLAAVESLERLLDARGLKARRLHTSHAFHSSMMDPILEPFTRAVRAVERKAPQVELYSNLTGQPLTAAEATDPDYWARHLRGAVRFSQGITALLRKPDLLALEVGPGNALTTFALQHPERATGVVVSPTLPHALERERDMPVLLEAVGKAWQAGVDVDWKAFNSRAARRRVSLPTYPFERQRHWLEPTLGPGAPPPGAVQAAPSAHEPADTVDSSAVVAAVPGNRPEMSVSHAPPRDALETELCEVWSGLLGIHPIGIHDSFFELGGDSVIGLQLLGALRDRCRVELAVRELFESPTVARLAERVRERQRPRSEAPAVLALPPLVASGREGPLPLSSSQQRLWFLEQLEPDTATYNLPAVLQMEGALDVEALRRSLDALVQRHEALRTTFASEDDQGVQRIHPPAPVPLEWVELRALPPETRDAEARRRALEELSRPFDLTQGPLLRATLLRLDDARHVLALVMHHIVSDGWSMGVLVRELAALYLSFRAGQPPALPPLPVQYADYALWQHRFLTQGDGLPTQLAWWRETLAGAPATLELPTDFPRPPVRSFRGAVVPLHLPRELADAIKERARQQEATPFMVLLAAWYTLLHRYSGQGDILVGSPMAGRRFSELEGLIGFFVNTLVLRARPGQAASFRALVDQVREMTLGAYAHQDVPFEKLVEELQPARDLGLPPLFQVFFALQNAPQGVLEVPGMKLQPLDLDPGTSKFDLEVSLFPTRDGFHGTLTYNTDLYAPATAERLAGHLRVLLEGALASPDAPLATLPLMPVAERLQVMEGFNATDADYPADTCLHTLVERQAALRPDSVAVESGEHRLTYAQLDALANRLAHRLRSLGVGPDVAVALCLERSPELVVSLLAILKAGGAYVPLDASYPAQRLTHMLEDSGARVLVTTRELGGRLPELESARRVYVEEDGWKALPSTPPSTGVSARNLAYVVFTSGSTGRPKGVAVDHRSLQRLLHAPRYAHLGPEESFLLIAPVSFDASVLELWGPLAFGGRLVLFPPQSPSDLELLGHVLEHHRVTTLHLTSGLFTQVVDLKPEILRGVRQLLTGGDVVSAPHVRKVLETLRIPVTACYGPTEATLFTTCFRMTRPEHPGTTVPIGQPLSNTRVYLLDDHFQPLPVGVPGELYVGGPGVARGYLGRPDLTAERFVPDPFGAEPGARLYRTGDKARWRVDGVLEFLGRIDTQVKVRGFRVELSEVEAALLAAPGIRAAVAVVREDVPGDKRLVAYVVPPEGQVLDFAVLRAFLQQRLPEYMVPSAIVPLDALPLTANAKVDRKALPAPEGALTQRAYVAPRTDTERRLALLLAEVLRVPDMGAQDDFFERGGHSLLATQALSRLRAAFGIALPLRALFESPSVERLALQVDAALLAGPASRLAPLKLAPRDGALPLSFAQQRLWFLEQLQPGTATYNIPAALRMEGALDVEALRQGFDGLVLRHEALRTTFRDASGRPVQVIHPAAPVPLPVVDLSGHAQPEAEATRLMLAEAVRPFDLEHGPLLRMTLLKLHATRHVLLMTMHHIVSDGWSMGVLIREMAALYRAFRSGQPAPLTPLPVQYADYAHWQRDVLQAEALESQLAYWRRQLAHVPRSLELPTDFPRPATLSPRGASQPVHLPRALTTALEAFCLHQGVTPFMALLATFQALLGRYSGQDDVVVGTPVAGRERPEWEGLIGLFVNTLPLRARLSGAESFLTLLGQARETTLGALAHPSVPFERLVEALDLERDLSRPPLVQVLFALQNAPGEALEAGGLTFVPVEQESQTAKLELVLSLTDTGDGYRGSLEYSTDLFTAATAARMVTHLGVLLESALARPEARLDDLAWLTPPEQQRIVEAWNDTRADFPRERCLHELFIAQALRTPEAIAAELGSERLTYRELHLRSNRLAWHLLSLGVRPEQTVAFCLERSFDLLVAMLGILKAGAAYVPIDAEYPADRSAFILRNSGAAILLTQAPLADAFSDTGARVLCLGEGGLELVTGREDTPTTDVRPDNLAYIIHTSGSTGRPKGVSVRHAPAINLIHWVNTTFQVGPSERLLFVTSPCFDLSVYDVFGVLAVGGTLVVATAKDLRDPQRLAAMLRERDITFWDSAPAALQQLTTHFGAGGPALRRVFLSGDWIPLTLPDAIRAVFPHAQVISLGGATEATIWSNFFRVGALEPAWTSIPYGRPISNARYYVLDARLRTQPVGVTGDLFIGGECLADGYAHAPALTAERFVPDPFQAGPGARMYKTGDRARFFPDGNIEFLGRADQQVKVRGFRVETGEIETVLAEHPAVHEAVVDARGPARGDRRLVAYLVARAGEALPSVSELRRWAGRKLPEYMVPSAFLAVPAIPITSNGKVDRKALPDPDGARPELEREFVAPRTALEQALASLWAQVLRLEQVGLHDNFFELGGHSLLATQVISRVRESLDADLPVRELFVAPTVAELAARIELLRAVPSVAQTPLLPQARDGRAFPLSFAQQRLWFLDQMEPGSPFHNIATAVRMDGPLDVAVLERCFQHLARRHEALRTTFRSEADGPVQVLAGDTSLTLERVDLEALPPAERERESARLTAEESLKPFDLARGPLMRATLLRLEPQRHLLLLTLHHVVSDGWSMGVVVREIASLYADLLAGGEPTLPALPVQYVDYTVWQRRMLQGEVLERQLGYWKERLAGAPRVLELPTDRPLPAAQTFHGARVPVRLPKDVSQALKALALREGATPFMVLLAAWQTLLHRYSGQEDVLVGSPVAGRHRVETEALVGCFVNTLVLRAKPRGDLRFSELLAQVQEAALGAFAHQDLPFEKLVEALQTERSLSHPPLCQVTFTLHNTPMPELSVRGLALRLLEPEPRTSPFFLSLHLEETAEGFTGALVHNTDLYDTATVAAMASHLATLARGIAEAPERTLGALPLMDAAEQEQLLREWNATASDYPRDASIHERFSAQAARTPDAVALVQAERTLTYAELERASNQVAHHLRALGVTAGARVGVYLERSVELVVALLGVLKAGAAYVPIDAGAPAQRQLFMLSQARVGVLLTQSALADDLPETGALLVLLDEEAKALAARPVSAPESRGGAEALAYVMFTSGSTGQPKGVCVPHRGVVRLVEGQGFARFGPERTWLQAAPVAFDASTLEIWGALLHGARLVLAPPHALSLEELGGLLSRHAVDSLWLTAALFEQMAQHQPDALAGVNQLLAGGDVLPAVRVREHLARMPPGAVLINGYGPTENTTFSVTQALRHGDAVEHQVPIGRPLAHSTAYVLDPAGQPVPVGVPGELHVGGDGLAWGYLDQPELTAERFVPNPFGALPGTRLYRTGDQVKWRADGTLAFLGRTDFQVKVRGFRIELGEVEAAVRRCPGVAEAVVVVREDVPGDKRLVAYVAGTQVDGKAVRTWVQKVLPDYMVPSAVVLLDALPLSSNGKVDRKALPAPEAPAPSQPDAFTAPRTETEARLAAIWAEVLHLERVGVDDDFFELGGHSLLATQVVSRIRATLGVELPLGQLFEAPTVALLAERLEHLPRVTAPVMERVERVGLVPLSFAQQRLWFLDQLQPGGTTYNVPSVVRLEGALDTEALRRALHALVLRHEVLRTTFPLQGDSPVQHVHPEPLTELAVVDLEPVPAATREHEAQRLAMTEAWRPFDLARGPLMRTTLLRLEPQRHLLLLTLHHIVTDGWSIAVLVRDLGELYRAFHEGGTPALPLLPLQYADYALWQHKWLREETLGRELAWWRDALEGAPAALELSTDRPRPAVQTFLGAAVPVRLERALGDAVKHLAQKHGATDFMVLLAAWQLLLSRYSGQDDVSVGSPIANRHHAETEGLVGFFVNTLVLRARIDARDSFAGLLARVRATALSAYAHQDVPFESLVEALHPQRDLSRGPLFQVMFALQNAPGTMLALPGLVLGVEPVEDTSAKFDLGFSLEERDGVFVGALGYNTDLFDPATVTRMARHFVRLLTAVTADADAPVSHVSLLDAAERAQVLVEWNRTGPVPSTAGALHHLVEAQVERTPDAIALVVGTQRLTYGQLDARANQLAHHLRALGVGPDVAVAVCLERTTELVVALLGVLKAGGAYVPLDPSYPQERLTSMLEDSRAPVRLTQRSVAQRLTAPGVQDVLLDGFAAVAHQPSHRPERSDLPEALAYVLYTSGSTGRPKGVAVAHRSAVAFVHWALDTFSREQLAGVLAATSVSFDLSVFELFVPLARGGRVYLADNALALASLPARDEVTLVNTVPSAMAELLRMEALPSGVRTVNLAGEPLPAALARALYATGTVRDVYNLYGPTEDTTYSTYARVSEQSALPPSIGRPLAGTQAYVLDAQLRPVPVGVSGELYLGGAGLARGYLHRPHLTAERFVPDPFASVPGARMYRTGDKIRWKADATLEYQGRIDFQVKVRGFRIELGEVEEALRAFPGVHEAVVVVREDVPGDRRLVAYVAPTQAGALPDVAALRAHVQQRLPGFMVPAALVVLPALPRTPNGKVDRKVLPVPEQPTGSASFQPPSTPTEQALAGLWSQVLGISRIGAEDQFFELGGHSLLATRVVSRIRSTFGVELPLRVHFEAPTLRELARRIDDTAKGLPGLPPLVPTSRDGVLPLSYAQQRLWFLDQLQPGSPAYNMPVALRAEGPLDVEALERAFEALVHRHETLRTTFAQRDGAPVQHIHPPAPFHLPRTDVTDAANPEAEVHRLAVEEAARPFDLAAGPLLRVHLLKLGGAQHVLLLTLHHIISDGWSTGVLVREMAALYQGFHDGRPTALPALPVQYADHAAWQRSWLHGDVLEQQVSWWRQHLAGAPTQLELPAGTPRASVPAAQASRIPLRLPRELGHAVEALARKEGATPFMVLLAAYQLLLSRYTGQDDLLVGTPIAGRRFSELEGLIGFFVNTLVLRARPGATASFRELLAQVREATLGAFEHQDVPFEKLVEELHPERDLDRTPLFQAFFVLQNLPVEALALPSLTLRPFGEELAAPSKFELSLNLSDTPDGLQGVLQYRAARVSKATATGLARHFQVLLESLVARPDQALHDLTLLTPEERQRMLVDWNDTAREPVREGTFHSLFEQQVARTPDAPAVRFENEVLTFTQLNAKSNQLAHALRARGVGPEVRVALCFERSVQMVVALLGVLKAGGAYVPLDPAWPIQRRSFAIQDSAARVVLTPARLAAELEASGLQTPCLDAAGEHLASEPTHDPAPWAGPDNLAYVIYTSGSTGTPKGVMVQHRSVLNLHAALKRTVYEAQPSGLRVSVNAPLAFDGSVKQVVQLLDGHCLCIVPDALRQDAEAMVPWVREARVDVLDCTPSLLRLLLQAGLLDGDFAPALLVPGGEALDEATWATLAASTRTRTFNVYGPTECTVDATAFAVRPRTQPTLGGPLLNVRTYVLDAHQQPVPVGVAGELFIAGAGLARGYLGQPARTSERFVPNPFATTPGERMYRTGDKARWSEDGTLEYLGRIDFQVKLRGLRIELGEIEALLRQHSAVAQALVLVREDVPGNARLVAYVVPSTRAPDAVELRGFLLRTLPESMAPAAYVMLDALPLTPNGKVDRKALPAPEAQAHGHEAPRPGTEEKLAALWADVLRVPTVGAQDDFFALGGHSLLATRVVARIRAAFDVELPVRALFEEPTLRRLAARIEHAGRARELPAFVPVPRTDTPPLSFAQQRMWFLDQLQPGSPAYNIPVALRIHGALDAAALERAFEALVHRHEALRTTIAQHEGVPVQHIHPPAPFHLPRTDLSGSTNPEAEARRLAAEEAARPFDLAAGPLLRVHLLRLSESQHVLLQTLHHIISDGWSTGVLVREMAALYQGFHDGRPTALPALPVQYADHAAWQRSWLHGDVLEQQVSWWRQHLAGAPTQLELPTGTPRASVPAAQASRIPLRLPRELGHAVEALARKEGATPFMVLLAAYQLLLSRYTGQDDLLVGTPIAGRRFSELEGL
ncbi:non-ribosomal peptide synthase/polyketide synthase, partial [Corallococcus sp. bb12-1]|uniref:non-ribosomal peptide synthase/polyketide synthase n=1 Tax=Corallococcus sp. bb12-1 TaxID=2996784 RepID=UPI00226E7EF3